MAKTIRSFVVQWMLEENDEVVFEADMKAPDVESAKLQFAAMFPTDHIVGVHPCN